MTERIVKRKQAQEGEKVHLEARAPSSLQLESAAAEERLRLDPDDADILLQAEIESNAKAEKMSRSAQAAADELLAQAREEAERLVAEAQAAAQETQAGALAVIERQQQEAQNDLAQQRQKLEQETRAALEQEYRERYLQAIQTLERAAAELQAKRDDYLASIEQPAFELVLALAQQLIMSHMNASPEALAPVIAQALSLLKPEAPVAIEVHPVVFHRLTMDESLQQALVDAGVNPTLVDLSIGEGLEPGQFTARLNGASLSYDLEQAVTAMAELFTIRARHLEAESPD